VKKNILVIVFGIILIGCTGKSILNIQNSYVPTNNNGERQSLQAVQEAIFRGTKRRGWSPQLVRKGLIEANISVRSHTATVEIKYDDASYSINYKDSLNLNYDGDNIHRNYNNWVLKLSRTIQQELGVNSQKY